MEQQFNELKREVTFLSRSVERVLDDYSKLISDNSELNKKIINVFERQNNNEVKIAALGQKVDDMEKSVSHIKDKVGVLDSMNVSITYIKDKMDSYITKTEEQETKIQNLEMRPMQKWWDITLKVAWIIIPILIGAAFKFLD